MPARLFHLPQILRSALPVLLPTTCALCGGTGDRTLCAACEAQYFHGSRLRCVCCGVGLPDAAGASCGACLKRPPAFDGTFVACDYAPPLDQLVLGLKFGNQLQLAGLLADMLRDAALLTQDVPLPTILTAVPLGARRLMERGFNQALEIAKPLSRALGVPLRHDLLVRQRETQAQSLLHPDERHKNMRDAFMVPAAALGHVRDQHVGIVDDVMTTGETLNAAAAVLKRFGAVRVTNFVFARTLPA